MSVLWMIGGFILVLSPIIIVHEFGHFWTAKKFGIHVEEFGLGFPPRAVKLFEKDGTIYSLNWIPLGGFVRPAGEDDPTVPNGLASASKTARFCVLVAGATANFILAFFILWAAFSFGPLQVDMSKVAAVTVYADSPAEQAGIQPNDVIVSVNGKIIADRQGLTEIVNGSLGKKLSLVIDRAGTQEKMSLIPEASKDDPTVGIMGIRLSGYQTGERDSLGPIQAAQKAVATMWQIVYMTVNAPIMLMDGQLTAEEARPVSIVGISQILGSEAQSATASGDWFGLAFFAGLINVGLGFTNLLPIPALDGGRILFVLIEAVRGRRMAPEREGMVHMVGMLLLLSLMALLIVKDVMDPIIPY